MEIKILTFAFSLMFNNAPIPDTPYNRFIELDFSTATIEASRTWSRFNSVNSTGERLLLSYNTKRGTNIEIEHFRNSGSDINIQIIRTRYWIFGNEIVYMDWYQGKPRYLYWLGGRYAFKRLTIGLSYSTDFDDERFSKSEIEFDYSRKLKGNWYLKPEFRRKAITIGDNDKSDWRFLVSFEWIRDR